MGVGGERGAGQTGHRAQAVDAQPAGFAPGPGEHGLQRDPADPDEPRAVPADHVEQVHQVQGRTDRDVGHQLDQQPADAGRAGSLRLGSECVRPRLAGQPGESVGVPPGSGQGAPAVGGVPFGPAVVVDGRQQPAAVPDGQQARRGRALEHERGVGVVGTEGPAEPGHVADGHPALPQQAVRCGLQGVGDQLDVVHEPVRGADGGAVDHGGGAEPTGQRRRGAGHGIDAEPLVAEVPGDLAGQQHRVRPGRPQQAPGQQLFHRGPGTLDGHGPIGAVDRPGGVPQQAVDDRARLGPGLGEPARRSRRGRAGAARAVRGLPGTAPGGRGRPGPGAGPGRRPRAGPGRGDRRRPGRRPRDRRAAARHSAGRATGSGRAASASATTRCQALSPSSARPTELVVVACADRSATSTGTG